MPVLTPETLAQLMALSQAPGQTTGTRSTLAAPPTQERGASPLQPRPGVEGRPMPGQRPGLDSGMQTLQALSQVVGSAGQAGSLANRFTSTQSPTGSPGPPGTDIPPSTPLVSPQLLGGLQGLGGLLNIGMALRGQPGQSSASRVLQGTGGAAGAASGAIQTFPETAASVLPSAGAFAPGNLGPALGVAGGLAGLGSGALALSKGANRAETSFDMMTSILGMIPVTAPVAVAFQLVKMLAGLGGTDRQTKTELMHEAETQGSQSAMAGGFGQAQSLEDILRTYTGISGTRATMEDLLDPLRREQVFRFPLDTVVRTPFEMAVERVAPQLRRSPETAATQIGSRLGVSGIDPNSILAALQSRPDLQPAWLARAAQPNDLSRLGIGPSGLPSGELSEFGSLGRDAWMRANQDQTGAQNWSQGL